MKIWTMAPVLTVLVAAPLAAGQTADRVEVRLKATMHQELVDGDLQAAIEQYKDIVARAGGHRAVAAKALLQMGYAYEKLGRSEARDAYERVLRDYADQADVAAQARARLAALTQPAGIADRSNMVVRRVWAGPGVDIQGMPTPDGQYLTFIDSSTLDVAVRNLATGESRRLTSNQSWARRGFGQTPVVSPDGTLVAYHWFTLHSELRVTSLTAATDDREPRVVFRNDEVAYLRSFAWSPDGERILTLVIRKDSTAQIALIAVTDGSMQVLKSLDWRYPSKMSLSPDGRYVAYDAPVRQDSPDRDIFILSVDGEREIALVKHPAVDYGPVWTPEGDAIVFASDRSGNTGLWAIHVEEGIPLGAPQLVKPDIGKVVPLGFSRDGSYYYGVPGGTEDVYVADLDVQTAELSSAPTRLIERFVGSNLAGAWSPDGRQLAYVSRRGPGLGGTGSMAVVIRSLETGEEREFFSSLKLDGRKPVVRWFPDSQSLLLYASDRGRHSLHRMDTQTGTVTLVRGGLGTPGFVFQPPALSPDGRTVYYLQAPERSIMTYDIDTGRQAELFRSTTPLLSLALSQDGTRLAFLTRERRNGFSVIPTRGGTPREIFREGEFYISVAAQSLEWTHDDRFILFIRRQEDGPAVTGEELWRVPSDGGEPHRVLSMDGIAFPSVNPNGRQLAFTATQQDSSDVWVMENFLPELKDDSGH